MRTFLEIERLASYSQNFEEDCRPFYLFANIVGWSEEYLGQPFKLRTVKMEGWLELHCLGAALIEWNQNPGEAWNYLTHLWENGIEE